MRAFHLFVAGAVALASLPVVAADHVVLARNGPGGRNFSPSPLTIAAGDTVTFKNDPDGLGFHNVKSDDGAITSFRCAAGCDGDGGSGDAASSAWSATVAFPTAGTVGYYCEIHGGTGGSGMAGVITIEAATGGPAIVVDPAALVVTAAAGSTVNSSFSIANTGSAALDWTADTASVDCATPDVVPWLLLSPVSGSVPAGAAASDVDVTLDATSLVEGVYNADICVRSNDDVDAVVGLPVEFTVSSSDVIFANGFDAAL